MTLNHKPTGCASSIPMGLARGLVAALGITLAGSLLTAKLLERQIIAWENSGYAVMVILLWASWAGAFISGNRIKRRQAVIYPAAGLLYFTMLLLFTALFFGGKFHGVWQTGLLILGGSMANIFTAGKGSRKRKTGKIRRHHC